MKKTQKAPVDDAIVSITNTQVLYVPTNVSVDYKSPFSEIGKDVYWYISGSKNIKDSSNPGRNIAVFGGDVVISGSLYVEGCELTGSFNFDCDTLELTGSIDVQGNGKFTTGLATSDITTVAGDPFFIAGTGITLSSDPATGQLTITQNIEWNERLSGTADGVNNIFTLTYTPSSPATIMVFVNGVLQENGITADFTISGNVITFNSPPNVESKVTATYSR